MPASDPAAPALDRRDVDGTPSGLILMLHDVTGVVALAPWLPRDEPVTALAGKRLAAAHGASDKITSPHQTQAFVRRAGSVAASTEFHDMGTVGHYMLRHIPAWNEFAVTRSVEFLRAHSDSR